ncbi:MAG: Serine/threonine protein kinase [Verrucomicrobiaceae bacterium]|nr:Serine/threonine protein kinase [Verrucomicrobiaceae bacterium]
MLMVSTQLQSRVKDGLPSKQIDPLLDKSLHAIMEPLEKDPKLPRVEVEKLRAGFAADGVKATSAEWKQVYQNAMAVCESLTKGMDDRATSQAAAIASSKAPTLSNGGSIIKSSPMRGKDAGAAANAIRKKQKDERKYEDNTAQKESDFVSSGAYRIWTDKAATLRKNVMGLYTRQLQYEALAEAAEDKTENKVATTSDVKGPRPKAASAEPSVMNLTGDGLALGHWMGASTKISLEADHSCIHSLKNDSRTVAGKWSWLDPKIHKVHMNMEKGEGFDVVFSDDGKTCKVYNQNEHAKARGAVADMTRKN